MSAYINMLSAFSSSAFGLRYFVTGGGGGGGGDPPSGWIGDEVPVHADSLLAHYDFNDGTANDVSGAGNHGSDVNSDAIASGGAKSGAYGLTGDGLYGINVNTTRFHAATSMALTAAQGLTVSFWLYPTQQIAGYNCMCVQLSGSTYVQVESSDNTKMRFKPSNTTFVYGALDAWHHIVVVMSNDNTAKVYSDGAEVYSNSGITFPGSSVSAKYLYSDDNNNKRCFASHMDDIRMFNSDGLSLENISALANSQYDASRLLMRLQMQDATDTQGNYGGTENGSCIDTTRFKYYTKSLTSDGVVGSAKYVEMPVVPVVESMGMSYSFWFYNEAGLSTGDSMVFESEQDGGGGSTQYVTQYKNDRTKFRFTDDTGCIVYAATGAWHKMVITVGADDVVNMWIDGSHDVTDVTVAGVMPSTGLDAGWRIGRNITNVGALCSFGGSIAEFKVWNRVLTATEAVAVA
jgi:hypothetical protein